jgi:arsenate reductase
MTTDDFPITIYHNPKCGTSRNVLAMIQAAGYAPVVVDYVKAGWDRDLIEALLASLQISAQELMRVKGTPAADLGLTAPGTTQDAIISAMLAHPILVNRPIVTTPRGAKLCRPSELVLSLLDRQPGGFAKEDGEVVQTVASDRPISTAS